MKLSKKQILIAVGVVVVIALIAVWIYTNNSSSDDSEYPTGSTGGSTTGSTGGSTTGTTPAPGTISAAKRLKMRKHEKRMKHMKK